MALQARQIAAQGCTWDDGVYRTCPLFDAEYMLCNAESGRDVIRGRHEAAPEWCPLREGPVVVEGFGPLAPKGSR